MLNMKTNMSDIYSTNTSKCEKYFFYAFSRLIYISVQD